MSIVQHSFDFDGAKVCNTCRKPLPFSSFYRCHSRPDGLQFACKQCQKIQRRKRYEALDLVEHAARMRTWRAKNQDKIKVINRRSYLANTEDRRASARIWRKANPARRSEAQHRRKARLLGTLSTAIAPSLLAAKMAYWGNRCWVCGGPQEQVDHVKPLSKGGPHILANLRPICALCNNRKNNTWPFTREMLGGSR